LGAGPFPEEAAAAAIVNVRVTIPLAPAAFDAPNVTVDVPATVGVPEIKPVVELNDNPAGRPVAVYEVGEFVAAA
jgi:hypothetical protein